MPNCSSCGSQVPEGTMFCLTCGAHRTAPPVPVSGPSSPRRERLAIVLVVAAVIIAIVIALAAIGAFYVLVKQNSGQATVSAGVPYPYPANLTADRPASGREWVVIDVTLTNQGKNDLTVPWAFFSLDSGGAKNNRPVYAIEGNVSSPGTVPPGQDRTFSVVFDIPAGSAPSRLTYNNVLIEASAPVPRGP